MPFKPKFPEACRHLDLALVSRTLADCRLDICAAAKALGVAKTDLTKLTWHDPKLLDEAKEAIELYAIRCTSAMIQDLYSSESWRRRRGAEQILASPLAYGDPLATLAPAPRSRPKTKSNKPLSAYHTELNRRHYAERDRLKALSPAQ
jgi:hypothetical protein